MKNKNFSRDFCIYYYNINTHKEVTISSLLNFLQETAISHSESVGYGIDNLLKERVSWILNRWSLEIEKYPLWNEVITVETWPSGFDRFFANREFLIKDSAGNIIARAASLWILLDIDRRRPKRIPEEFGHTYGITNVKSLDNPFSDFVGTENSESKRKYYVRRSDIDTNAHVNNVSYVDWMQEAVPDEIHENYFIKSLEVVYKKETVYGSEISSLCESSKVDEKCTEFKHSIKDAEGTAELAIGKTIWHSRNNFT